MPSTQAKIRRKASNRRRISLRFSSGKPGPAYSTKFRRQMRMATHTNHWPSKTSQHLSITPVSSRQGSNRPSTNTVATAGSITPIPIIHEVESQMCWMTTAAKKRRCLTGKIHESETCLKTVTICIWVVAGRVLPCRGRAQSIIRWLEKMNAIRTMTRRLLCRTGGRWGHQAAPDRGQGCSPRIKCSLMTLHPIVQLIRQQFRRRLARTSKLLNSWTTSRLISS